MNILVADKITKVYGEKTLFKDACLGINEGDKIGLIGINGTGKSTFLKILAGLEETDLGEVIKGNNVTIEYLPQSPIFGDNETVLEYVTKDKHASNQNWSIEAEAKSILTKLQINDFDSTMNKMSGGEKKRVALARTLVAPASVLILDEPTNHLDNSMVTWLEEYLIKFKGVLIMVTHDRYFLDRVTNKIIELDNASIYSYEANYSKYLELREQRLESEIASNRKRESILRTELEWVKRGARARSTKQKARLERYEELKNMDAPVKDSTVMIDSVSSRLGKKTIEINNINKSYGDKKLIDNFTYYTIRNERLGIIGNNGCGKSTLLKLIMGNEELDSGFIDIGDTIKIGYFAQEVTDMPENERVIDYIKNVAEYVETNNGKITASAMLEKFLFVGAMQYTPVSKLSGGEKRRLYLLKVLMAAPNVLILDEPTNDLDIATLTILEDYLDSFNGIVITVSHDRYFLDRVVDRILAFEGNGIINQYDGDYSDYISKSKQVNTSNIKEPSRNDNKDKKSWKTKDTKLRFTYNEKLEFENIDTDIEKLELKIEDLDKQIISAASQYTKLNELMQLKDEASNELDHKMERWIYLNDLNDQINNQ